MAEVIMSDNDSGQEQMALLEQYAAATFTKVFNSPS